MDTRQSNLVKSLKSNNWLFKGVTEAGPNVIAHFDALITNTTIEMINTVAKQYAVDWVIYPKGSEFKLLFVLS